MVAPQIPRTAEDGRDMASCLAVLESIHTHTERGGGANSGYSRS